jgi:hypothetical protein
MHESAMAQLRQALQLDVQSRGSVVELELSSAPVLAPSLELDVSELELVPVSLLVAPVLSLPPDVLPGSSKHAVKKSEASATRRIAAE